MKVITFKPLYTAFASALFYRLIKDPIDFRLIYLMIVLKEYFHQKDELGITVGHIMGNNMENNFPNFCIFLIVSGAVSYVMAFCQLTLMDS